ncbi:unnamed protein product [Rotaria sordida]|uniref:Death domain-containing protein n=1 Tax=Rotaria sordida TaxID=392033 RepID=A0A819GMA6_9BILA|nr:unnamed protein product [Rotaria sordida]CAF3885777.1 unnamed protein product [Rotaria sordida]
MTTTTTMLDKPLDDLCREITDLRQMKIVRDYDMNKLSSIITISKDSLKETEKFQQQILKQLQQFEISLADINEILRANSQQKIQLEQQQQLGDDVDIRAKLMALNAEALECRAAAVQLQFQAKMVLSKTTEIEKRANDELAQQTHEMKIKQHEIEKNRAEEYERRARLEEERQRLKELQQKQQEQERLLAMTKNHLHEDEYSHWLLREFMNDNQYPPCIIRISPNASSIPISIDYSTVTETENLLDNQEELISTPINIKFDLTRTDQQFIILAIPYILRRSSHRENIIKVRQSNGVWISIETNESIIDSYKEKRFVECKLNESSICAVVSRLKHDIILIQKQSSGRYISNADPRFTLNWPQNISQNDFSIDVCIQPVDLQTFIQFSQNFSSECQGLLAVGPIIELNFDEINLLKPIQFTLPILIQPKKKSISSKIKRSSIDESNNPQQPTISHPSQQETIDQQQQLIFKSMLGEDLSNERLVLLYSGFNDNTWHIDTDIQLIDSKTHDIITTNIQYLHSRIIVVRCDKQLMSLKQLPTTICLLDQTLNQRSVTLFLRRRLTNLNEICLVCCSSQRRDTVENEIQQENYSTENEQIKEIILEEGQILELRFRGNVIPINNDQQSIQFAFNTYFPFYFETNVSEIDKYSQHLSSYFYGFIQIFSKQKFLRNGIKEIDKKKQQSDIGKQEWQDSDICLAELLITLPKPPTELRTPIQKSLTTFTGEGILTPTLFRDMSTSLVGDEWRRLARRLGMTRIRIEAIEHDYHEDAPYYMLLTWFKRVPRSSDKVLLLIHGLININRWDLAQDLQSIKDDKRFEQGTSSKDEQLKLFRAPFMRICQRDECIRIWKQLARELMLSNEVIQHIEQQYPSKHERCLRSLEHWALNQPRADIPCLARIIRTLGFKPLAREIENMA